MPLLEFNDYADSLGISADALTKLVLEVDHEGSKNVWPVFDGNHPKGGPFGAGLYLQTKKGAEPQLIGYGSNRVLETFMASYHGERVAIEKHGEALAAALKDSPNANVLLVSSAEGCTGCRSATEMFARELMEKGLVKPGKFGFVWGGSYENTEEFANFDDALYCADFQLPNDEQSVRYISVDINAGIVPNDVRVMFSRSDRPLSLVINGGKPQLNDRELEKAITVENAASLQSNRLIGLTRLGQKSTVLSTLETDAISEANRNLESFILPNAILFTGENRGPFMHSIAQWSGVKVIATLTKDGKPLYADNGQNETPKVSNPHFYKAVKAGYDAKGLVLNYVPAPERVRQLLTAQRLWGQALALGLIPPAQQYNGVNGVGPSPKHFLTMACRKR